jgi:regulator of protease activity HflC (stomatin/prohibitin superfamily)
VTVRVDAVVYYRVVDPVKATVNVQNYLFAVS